MKEARVNDVGRRAQIEGSRITVFDVLDYLQAGWHRTQIALLFRVSTRQIDAAVRYIDEHKAELIEQYHRILERDARGNPPELQAKLDEGHARFLAMVRERRRAKEKGSDKAGHSGGP